MSQIDGRQPVIVKLGDDSTVTGVQTASFEEAFGYSNFGGKGRERRKKRKAAHQQKKMTRISNRVARKTARKVGRQTEKQARIEAKSAKKDARLQGRLNRKSARKDSRGGSDDEAPEMEDDALPVEDAQDTGADPTAEQDTDGQDTAGQDESQDNTEAAEDAGGSEEAESDEQESPSEDEDGYAGDDDSDSMFSGDERESSFNAENEPTVVTIGPEVMDKARRIVWNEMLINKLENQMSNAEGDPMELQVAIDGRHRRIQELESQLDGYSEAKGGGKKAAARKEVKAAKKAARHEAKVARKEAHIEKRAAKRAPAPKTEVAEDLNATSTETSIEVPAAEQESGFDGDGMSGTKSVIKFKHVAIAFGIGLALFAAYKISTMKKVTAKV